MTDAESSPRKVLVAALGNPDRGDDGVGAAVAAKLAGRLPLGAEILTRRGGMLSLIDDWAGCDALVCVDAAAGATPGHIHRFDLAAEKLPRELSFASSHAMGLPETIELARVLDRAPERIIVYAIEGRRFDAGAALSPDVSDAVTEAADRIVEEVSRLLSRCEVSSS